MKQKKVMVGPMIRMGNEELKPPWLRPLLKTSFFKPYEIHAESTKNECNMYCLDCMGTALCSYCLSNHKGHHYVQEIIISRRHIADDHARMVRINEVLRFSIISIAEARAREGKGGVPQPLLW
ncbi:RING/U-box-containing protein [Dioscorea alata]|uniref:RING/U-box-containing protein n=1 Tax=Dioscorea alata TaxID=55571 RepID=A0ACB7V9E2_DIOAL|nr:RING/U-box-containing protein [Dioscorea alata]